MDSLPEGNVPSPGRIAFEKFRTEADEWGAFLDRLEAWRDSPQWEGTPAATRRGVEATLDHAEAVLSGLKACIAHPGDRMRRKIEQSHLMNMRDYAATLFEIGMDAWEEATGSREIPVSAARPRSQAPPPERTPAMSVPREVPATKDKSAGLVYLLRSDLGHYKIGHTKNVRGRLAQFTVALPFGFEFIHTIPCRDRVEAEAQLHARFADRRNNGEWFDLTAEDVEYIKSLTEL